MVTEISEVSGRPQATAIASRWRKPLDLRKEETCSHRRPPTDCRFAEFNTGAGETPGRWHGRGAAGRGLTAGVRVSERQLEALFGRALHPVTGTGSDAPVGSMG